ncbi:MAG: hypothetical protein ACLPHP_14860 [Candidatus Sulfotelmatobacter sp.]
MRKTEVVVLVALGLIVLGLTMVGCGSRNTGNSGINGNWTATLKNADGSIVYQFSATLTPGTGNTLNVSNLNVANSGQCLSSSEAASGSFIPTNAQFGMSMVGFAILSPDLSLQGELSGSTISGTWTLSGGGIAACAGNGTFTMQPSMAD